MIVRLFLSAFIAVCLGFSTAALAGTAESITATEQKIEKLNADIKAANQNKEKERAAQLRQQRSDAQAKLRELKQQLRAENAEAKKQTKRAAAEAQWETYPADKKLCAAVEYNRLDLVQKVINSGAIKASEPNSACLYPLGDAAARGFAEITEYLLQKGAPLTTRAPIMDAKISAMDAAAGSKEDRTAILAILKKYGATPFDSTDANLAGVVVGDDAQGKQILKEKYNVTDDNFTLGATLTKSLEKGHVNNIRWLLANGSSPEEASNGLTALMIAVSSKDPEKVKLLVEAGADVNRRGIGFQSVLAFAQQQEARVGAKHKTALAEIIAYLQSRGATRSDKDRPL